MLRTY